MHTTATPITVEVKVYVLRSDKQSTLFYRASSFEAVGPSTAASLELAPFEVRYLFFNYNYLFRNTM